MKTKMILMLTSILPLLTFGQSIDVAKSSVKWHAEKVTGFHDGTIKLQSGTLTEANNTIKSGTFVVDMNTIANTDITDAETAAKLVEHLKSDDFFGVATYKTAKLTITSAEPFKNGKAKVKANLTIKANTLPIEFEVTKSGKTYKAKLVIDRSKYDVRYGSGSFFEGLGDNLIYDEFTLDVEIVSTK